MNLSTIFHRQTDSQAERTMQTLEDMLRACVIDLKVNWDEHTSHRYYVHQLLQI